MCVTGWYYLLRGVGGLVRDFENRKLQCLDKEIQTYKDY